MLAEPSGVSLTEAQHSAIVDLQQTAEFQEPFYLVVLERTNQGTTIHTWRILISSQTDNNGENDDMCTSSSKPAVFVRMVKYNLMMLLFTQPFHTFKTLN